MSLVCFSECFIFIVMIKILILGGVFTIFKLMSIVVPKAMNKMVKQNFSKFLAKIQFFHDRLKLNPF